MKIGDGSQEQARKTFEGERSEALVLSLDTAWGHLTQLSAIAPLTLPRSLRTAYWDWAKQALTTNFSPLAGVEEVEFRGLFVWFVDNDWAVRLKTYDSNTATHNIETQQQQRLRNWDLLPGMAPTFVVEIGPRPDAMWASPGAYLMARHIGRELEWTLDLRDLAHGSAQPIGTPQLPFEAPGAAGVRVVKRRVKRRSDAPDQ